MEKFFKIEKCNILRDNKIVINDISIDLDKSICILGESGSYKTFFLNEIYRNHNIFKSNGKIAFYFHYMLKKDVFVKYKSEMNEDLFELYKYLINNNKNLENKFALIRVLMINPDYFLCDDLYRVLDFEELKMVVNYINKKNIKMLYLTSDIESTVLFEYLIVLKNNKIAIEGKTLLVLKEEKIMKLLGFNLPFYVNMSIQLGYYGIINEIYNNEHDLVEALWQLK